jgi:CMP-N,N'-diacetyllegionaminic acid synthase
MNSEASLLAVIPARGGSKGLPGKNIRPLCGLPLIGHSIRLARLCPQITRVAISTDSAEIAEVARKMGADVPFMRPPELAEDGTPMWAVLQHALQAVENLDGKKYQLLLLLDPTSPCRLPEDIAGALSKLQEHPDADGIIGVSQPDFNPIWHCVIENEGWMSDLVPAGALYTRRQDVPRVYRINASLYIWRAAFIRKSSGNWRADGRHLMYEVPENRAVHIDTLEEFQRAELLIREGFVNLPWLG